MSEPILVRATHEQYLVTLARQVTEWGNGLSLEQFNAREATLQVTPFGQTLQCWVLVPANDPATAASFCACETFRRPVLLSSGRRTVGYSVASVVTPPEHRQRGYAQRMMELLAAAVRDESGAGADWEDDAGPWTRGSDALLSVLYSDVGAFYRRCGWEITGPTQTTWTLAALPTSAFTSSPSSSSLVPIPFDLATLTALAKTDSALLASSLEPGDFAMEPTGPTFHWHFTKSVFIATARKLPIPPTWGFSSPTSGACVLFTFDVPKNAVKILRLRTTGTATETRELLRGVFVEAKRAGCEKVRGWNVEREVLDALAEGERGETCERQDSLSALNWFGSPEEKPSWVANEGYAWC